MKKRVLIVDDDKFVQDILAMMLSKNYEVVKASNGKEAIEKYFAYRPDLVLMDIEMPHMDGIQATKEILKRDPKAKIVGITAFAPQKGENMIKAGALEVVSKPITKLKLIETVKKHIE